MSKKSLGNKIKLAFLIYLNAGGSPGSAGFWTNLKMLIFLFVGIAIPSATIYKWLVTQSFDEAFKVFFCLTMLWLLLLIQIKVYSRL